MSTPDLLTVRQAFLENADYAEVADVSKAKAFQTACRRLIVLTPTRTAKGGRDGEEIELDVQVIQQQLLEVTRWLACNDSASLSGQTAVVSFEYFRG
jgi:hypothetical protein